MRCVFYGEPTVNLQGKGSGGRNQELVLRLIALYKRKNMRCIVASMGTDGIDGNTKYAGAIYDTARSCSATEITRFLKENDSSSFFAKHGGHILTGPTGTNLADVGFVIVRKARLISSSAGFVHSSLIYDICMFRLSHRSLIKCIFSVINLLDGIFPVNSDGAFASEATMCTL